MPFQESGARRRPSLFDVTFCATLSLYVLLIGGVVLASFLMVAGTPIGRVQFMESIQDPAVLHAVWLSLWTSSVAAIISLLISVPSC